jgi:hypothetical protein
MNFTAEQMLSVAELITGKPHQALKMAYGYRIVSPNVIKLSDYGFSFPADEEFYEFKPSLIGSRQERAQACDVIVAAFKLPNFRDFHRIRGGTYRFAFEEDEEAEVFDGPDLLTASLLAILETTCKQMS